MSEKNGGSLQPARDVAEMREQAAAKVLGQKQHALTECVTRLESLRRYRKEYSDSLNSPKSLDANRLRDYRAFLARLNDAIAQQERVMEHVRSELEIARLAWQHAHTKVLALDRLLEHRAADVRNTVERREQNTLDDLARTRFLQK